MTPDREPYIVAGPCCHHNPTGYAAERDDPFGHVTMSSYAEVRVRETRTGGTRFVRVWFSDGLDPAGVDQAVRHAAEQMRRHVVEVPDPEMGSTVPTKIVDPETST